MAIKSEHGVPQVRPRLIALLATVALLAGCARVPEAPPAVRSHALAPRHGGVLAVLETRLAETHGPELSGFMLPQRNEYDHVWRLARIDTARHSLDLQYYVWRAPQSCSVRTP